MDFPGKDTEWAAISFSRGPPNPGMELMSPALAGGFFTTGAWEAQAFTFIRNNQMAFLSACTI